MTQQIRLATKEDLSGLMPLFEAAVAYFKGAGIPQWQDGYPSEETILGDILSGRTLVLEENGKIFATLAFCPGNEPTYNRIYEGVWQTPETYVALHRVAVDPVYKGGGLGGKMIEYAANLAKSQGIGALRGDTHRQNASMRRLLEKNGFVYRGIIYLENGDERIAFDRLLG